MGLGRTKRGPRHRQSSHSRQRCPPEPKAATRGATTARGPSPGGAAEQISTFRSEVSPSEKKFDRAVNWWRDVHSSPSIVVRANDERKSSMTTCNLANGRSHLHNPSALAWQCRHSSAYVKPRSLCLTTRRIVHCRLDKIITLLSRRAGSLGDTMFIAIVGTPSAGKRTVLEYLVDRHGFLQVGLEVPKDQMAAAKIVSHGISVLAISECIVTTFASHRISLTYRTSTAYPYL